MCTYSGHWLYTRGKLWVLVKFQGMQVDNLNLYVVDSEGLALFGRECLHYIKLNREGI